MEYISLFICKGNSAAFTVDDDLVVYADPEKLARVFSNLLKNAAAYSYPNTEIIITAKRCGIQRSNKL